MDVGFVCSICLSSESDFYRAVGEDVRPRANGHAVFCSPPEGAECLTCGTHLRLGEYGGKPAVVAKRKKKRKKPTDE